MVAHIVVKKTRRWLLDAQHCDRIDVESAQDRRDCGHEACSEDNHGRDHQHAGITRLHLIEQRLDIPCGGQTKDESGVVSALLSGTLAGLVLGLASARYVESLLYQVKASDPGMLVISAMVIFGAGLVAAIPPILRALHIDPVAMLRVE